MKIIEPCTLVIFGAAGNLSRRKLIPALFSLEKLGRLPEKLVLLACNIEQRKREVRHVVEHGGHGFRAANAAFQFRFHLGLPHAGGGGQPGTRTRVHVGRR